MSPPQTIVIVGASLAGAKAAETLRTEGFDGRVVLVGEEPERPYERPPLSKGYLRGEHDRAKIYVHDEGFYEAHDIELRTSSRVTGIDATASEVILGTADRVRYDRLLLTTGAVPRRLGVPGADLRGSATCAAWRTPTACRRPFARPAGWWSWAPAGSGAK